MASRVKNRNYILTHSALLTTIEECAALKHVWPANTCFVGWAWNPVTRTFRAYIEFDRATRITVLRDIPFEHVTNCSNLIREDRLKFVTGLEGAVYWKHGEWIKPRKGRCTVPTADQSAVSAADAPPNSVQAQLDEISQALNEQRLTIEEQRQRLEDQQEETRLTIEEQRQRLEDQQLLIEELQARPVASVTHNHNLIQANTVIVICNFGFEDKSYISPETLRQRYMSRIPGILETIRDVHCNPDQPQNANVKVVSRRNQIAAIRSNGEWMSDAIPVIVDKLLWNGFQINRGGMSEQDLEAEIESYTDDQKERYFADMWDINAFRSHDDNRKRPVVLARSQARAMLLELPSAA